MVVAILLSYHPPPPADAENGAAAAAAEHAAAPEDRGAGPCHQAKVKGRPLQVHTLLAAVLLYSYTPNAYTTSLL